MSKILQTPEEIAKHEAQAKAVQESMKKDLTTAEFEVVGVEDENDLKRVISFMKIPNNKANAAKLSLLSDAQIYGVFKVELMKHAERIGWYPDGDGPDFVVKQLQDGSWLGVMKSKKSLFEKNAKDWGDFPQAGVNSMRKDDVEKQK